MPIHRPRVLPRTACRAASAETVGVARAIGASRGRRGGGPALPGLLLALALLLGAAGCARVTPPPGGAAAPGSATAKPRLAWVSYPDAEVADVTNVHAHNGAPLCQACHVGATPALRREPVPLCVACHKQGHSNHPVDVRHKQPAKELPYGEGGRVVCHTCHDPHDLKAQRWGLRLAFNDLCLRCHQKH